MRYAEAIQTVDTEKALSVLGLEIKKDGSYIRFPAPCGHEVVIRWHGEKKNVIYCPECKKGSNIFQLALDLKGIDYADLVEKTAKPDRPIEEELNLNYELEWTKEMEKEGLNRELCERLGVGRPKGKTMLSGCVAFTVHNEAGVKIAYWGIRLADRKAIFHKSFNPELYLYNFHNCDPREEVRITNDLFACLHVLLGGNQCVCNFGLPYLSLRQYHLLSGCDRVVFQLQGDRRDIAFSNIKNLTTFYRFV
jgi:hypothetical protein